MKKEYDLIVIGGGSAGYAAASTAAALGLCVALAEGGPKIGGLCILGGCMPSKAFIESANRALTIRRAAEFGLRAGKLTVEGAEILERKRRFIEEFSTHRREQLESGRFDFIRAMAAFADPHTLEVTPLSGEPAFTLESKTFLIATGSALDVIEIPGLCETGFLNSDTVLDSPEIPESVIILGGGATAVEFSHYYASLGAKVTMLQRSGQILKEMDTDVSTALASAFEKRGISVLMGTTLLRVEAVNGRKRVHFRHDGLEKMAEASEIVYGLGRVPQLAGLRLDRAGVRLKKERLIVNESQQTEVPHIFAAGDVVGPHEIVHLAVLQGEVAARNTAKILRDAESVPSLEKMDYRLKLFAVFSMPEATAVGMTEKELTDAGIPYRTAKHCFHDLGKAIVMGETEGFVKLIVHRDSREILGASAVGIKVSELIHEIVVAMYFHATARDLMLTPHYHPTLSEIWTYPAEELACTN